MARRPTHESPSTRSARSGPRAKPRPTSGGVDPRWSNPELREGSDSAGDSGGGSHRHRRGNSGPRRPERKPSSGTARARGDSARTASGGPGRGSRERQDSQRGRRDEQGSRPQRTATRGAPQHGRDLRERDRGAPRKSGDSPRGPRRSPGARRSATRLADAKPRTDTRRGGPHRPEAEGERLQKVLSRAGLASRREAEDWIRAGRITVNGQPAVLGVRVSPADQLRLDGRLIRQLESTSSGPTVFVVHRSPGESLTQPPDTSEEGGEAPATTTMIERLPSRAGRRFITVSPMPRVDGGLELVTSDGELGVMLQRSVHKLVSQFSVRILGELSEAQLEGVLGGMLDSGEQIEAQTCEPSGGEAANRWYTFVARGASGKQVRQLFERQGALVSRVQRTHLGPITMERTLGRGQFRALTPEELSALTASPDE
jgi:23S rRNA pseudouridine2605 synthase